MATRRDAAPGAFFPRGVVLTAFAAVLAFAAWRWGWGWRWRQGSAGPLLLGYLVMSAGTLLAYALDKSAAVAGRWRISEQTLHLLALAGGWPGALLGQRLLRHKTRKPGFIAVFWLTVVLNVAVYVAVYVA